MNDRVLQSFLRTRNGYSPDAVIADPALNAQFLSACRESGATETDFALNKGCARHYLARREYTPGTVPGAPRSLPGASLDRLARRR